jgi:predicted RNA-binding protein (virulence factor B family)
MPAIGKINTLTVLRKTDYGLILDGDDLGGILMPNRYVTGDWKEGDTVEIFLMLDSEDRLTATTERPIACVDEFALLKVVDVTEIGAFLDWGLPKDLLVPFREQNVPLREGQSVVVRIYLDEVSGRIAASCKLDNFLDLTAASYAPGEKVELMIGATTDLGYKAIINGRHSGMIFHNEIFQELSRGQKLDGYIKQVRPDGKVDLSLQEMSDNRFVDLADEIVACLKEHDGFLAITDKSDPEEIYSQFGVSKKAYKRAVGSLYKDRIITFEDDGIKLAAKA